MPKMLILAHRQAAAPLTDDSCLQISSYIQHNPKKLRAILEGHSSQDQPRTNMTKCPLKHNFTTDLVTNSGIHKPKSFTSCLLACLGRLIMKTY